MQPPPPPSHTPAPPPPPHAPARAGHYDRRTDRLRISVDWQADSGLNKREALEQLVALVAAAQELAARHGPMRPLARFPKYSY